jgi:DNA/RNA endonuclease YhcR with UshA esterase domain
MRAGIAWLCLACSIAGLPLIYAVSGCAGHQRVSISELNEGMSGSNVIVSGAVVEMSEHQNGHLFIKLQDESGGVLTVPLFSDVRSGVGVIEILDWIEVRGEVSVYRGQLEVIPSSARDIRVQRVDPILPSDLSENLLGKLVKVEGTVESINRLSGGQVIITLTANCSKVKVFIPKNVAGSVSWLMEGVSARVGGWYQLYNGEPEIRVLNQACLTPVRDTDA